MNLEAGHQTRTQKGLPHKQLISRLLLLLPVSNSFFQEKKNP